jgi:hypothetical protein
MYVIWFRMIWTREQVNIQLGWWMGDVEACPVAWWGGHR